MTTYAQVLTQAVNMSESDTTQSDYNRSLNNSILIIQGATSTTVYTRTLLDSVILTESNNGGLLWSETIVSTTKLLDNIILARKHVQNIAFTETLTVNVYDVISETVIFTETLFYSSSFDRTGWNATVTILQTLTGQHYREGKVYNGIKTKLLDFGGPV